MKETRLGIALGLTASLLLVGCGSTTPTANPTAKVIRVGYSAGELSNQAQFDGHLGAVAEAKALGVQVFETHCPDAACQATGIADLFSKGIDVLAIDPNDGKAIGTSVQEANAKHIPVVMFIGGDEGGGSTVTFITTNEEQGGYDVSKAMFQKLGGHGNVAFVQGCICHPAGVAREAGFRRALAENPGIKLVAYGAANWDEATANTLVADMLYKHPGIDAVITLNDSMVNGAYRAVKAANGHAITSGYNGFCSTLKSIWAGDVTATLDQEWRGIGSQVVATAVAVAKGESQGAQVILPSYFLDKQAMQQIQGGTFSGQTPALTASVKAAVSGCPPA